MSGYDIFGQILASIVAGVGITYLICMFFNMRRKRKKYLIVITRNGRVVTCKFKNNREKAVQTAATMIVGSFTTEATVYEWDKKNKQTGWVEEQFSSFEQKVKRIVREEGGV